MKIFVAIISVLLCLSCGSGFEFPNGGYDYPKAIKPEDSTFYFLPVKDSFSQPDSFLLVTNENEWYQRFKEPNLSLAASKEPVFRLLYEGFGDRTTVISLIPGEITVKQDMGGVSYRPVHEERLSAMEKFHFNFLKDNFPLSGRKRSERRQHYIDSIAKSYPVLYETNYYLSLLKKARIDTIPARYSVNHIKISEADYDSLVLAFNKSGYWHLPLRVECINPPMDGYGYILEANTAKKYNCVISGCCENQERLPFAKACQQLIDKAGLGKQFKVYWDGHIDSSFPTDSLIIQDVQLENLIQKKPKRKKAKH